jgi:3-deoxy-manno-octulosonate cytidylyltransferase (CMP-KDO synthetase)
MLNDKKIACVIPARLGSTRFPKKVLAPLKGKPLIQWVWEAANQIPFFDEVTFAIDAEETAACIRSFGGKYHFTSELCPSGTDRLVELMDKIDADIYVNWQGDEPFIHQKMIQDLLQTSGEDASDVWTLKKKITSLESQLSPHIAKVVTDAQGYALYFSRATIPYYRDFTHENDKIYFKHVGIYAYSRAGLAKIAQFAPCLLEEAEKLEQLRFLYHGLKVRVHETEHEVLGIDLPEHLVAAELLWL